MDTYVYTGSGKSVEYVNKDELIARLTTQTYALTDVMRRVTDPVLKAEYHGMFEAHKFTLKILGVTDI